MQFNKTDVWGFSGAIRGMRNAMNSWDRSDSLLDMIGEEDMKLAKKLISAGSSHRKFLRQIFVSVDITAPIYWWKEADTYKVGTTANSTSTMHKITAKEFELDDFSHDHLTIKGTQVLEKIIEELNGFRESYLASNDAQIKKDCWYNIIQLLPSSYNQKRTWTADYEIVRNMVEQRKGHKLDEWHKFIEWAHTLPYADMLIFGGD